VLAVAWVVEDMTSFFFIIFFFFFFDWFLFIFWFLDVDIYDGREPRLSWLSFLHGDRSENQMKN